MEGHLFIYGVITPYQDDEGQKYGEISLTSVKNQVEELGESLDSLIIHIRSEGGDYHEGFAIFDYIKTLGIKVSTRVEGICASIATVIALAGETRSITENSTFMIHNPWTFTQGNADDLEQKADQLKALEENMITFYNSVTGIDKKDLKTLMDNETFMTANEAKEKGFFTEVLSTIKAVAHFNTKIDMNKAEFDQKIDSSTNTLFEKIKNLISPVKAFVMETATSEQLNFGEEIKAEEEIVEGVKATIDGKAADGDYTMPSGKVFSFTAGSLSGIKEAEPTEVQALQTKNSELETELETVKASLLAKETELSAVNAGLKTIKEEITSFKAQIKSDMKDFENNKPGGQGDDVNRKPFKTEE